MNTPAPASPGLDPAAPPDDENDSRHRAAPGVDVGPGDIVDVASELPRLLPTPPSAPPPAPSAPAASPSAAPDSGDAAFELPSFDLPDLSLGDFLFFDF